MCLTKANTCTSFYPLALLQCAEESMTQSLVKEHGGLEPLANLLKETEKKDLLCAVTGAVWKCSKSADNVTQ